MVTLLRRIILLALFTAVLWTVQKRKPASMLKAVLPVIAIPFLGTILNYLFKWCMSMSGVQNQTLLSLLSMLLTVVMEILMICACLVIYKGFRGNNDRLMKLFLAQPKWANIILLVLVVSLGALHLYDSLHTLTSWRTLSSQSSFDNLNALNVMATLATPSLAANVCTLINVAVVGVEAFVCRKKITSDK